MLLFLIGCIGMRTLIVLIAMNIDNDYLPYMGYVSILISISFFYLFIFGNRIADSQLEQYKDKKLWWNKLRLFHGFMYLLFAIFAIQKNSCAWIPLGFDVVVGLGSWLNKHYIKY